MNLTLIPFKPHLGKVKENVARACEAVEMAVAGGADVVMLPENSLSGYFLEGLAREVAVSPSDSLFDGFLKLSEHAELIVPTLIRLDRKLYSAGLVFSGGELVFIHRKVYLPSYGMFDEPRYLSAGDRVETYSGKFGKCGILLCEDACHPVLAYSLNVSNARFVFVPSASPNRGIHSEKQFASELFWQRQLQVYAQSYGQSYAYLNRTGVEEGAFFGGQNFLIDSMLEMHLNVGPETQKYAVELNPLTPFYSGGAFQSEDHSKNKTILEKAWENL